MGFGIQKKPGGSTLAGLQPIGPSGPMPGKSTRIEQVYGTGMDYVDQGAMCDRASIGVCNLESGQRSRLMQIYQYNVGQAGAAFKSGAAMARMDVLLEPDAELSWIVELALDAGGLAIAKSLGRAVTAFGDWANGAQASAYDRLFEGEFVSERKLKLYGAAAQVPLGPLEGAADIAVAQGKTGLSKALAGGSFGGAGRKQAKEVFLRELAIQAARTFNYLVTTVGAHLDDAALLLMTESFDPAAHTEFDYKDAIMEKIDQFSAMKLDKIGHGVESDVGNTAGHTVERGAIYVVRGGEQRMALIEVDGPVDMITKGDSVREIYPRRSRFVEWIDDVTMQHAAEQLTSQRGNGNIGTVTADAANAKLEGFRW